MLIIFSFFSACEKDDSDVKEDDYGITEIDMDLFPGNWSMTEQYTGDKLENCFSIARSSVNMNTGEIMWTDIIKFGLPTFYFSEENDFPIFSTFILKSENMRDLYGYWELSLTENKHELRIRPSINEYMCEDTIINGHNYSFDSFVPGGFKIFNISDSKLVLTTTNDSLVFKRLPALN